MKQQMPTRQTHIKFEIKLTYKQAAFLHSLMYLKFKLFLHLFYGWSTIDDIKHFVQIALRQARQLLLST